MYLQRAGRGQTQSWLLLAVAVKMVHEVHPCLTSVARETNSNLPCSSTPRCLVHLHYLKQFIHFHHSLHVCVPLPPSFPPTHTIYSSPSTRATSPTLIFHPPTSRTPLFPSSHPHSPLCPLPSFPLPRSSPSYWPPCFMSVQFVSNC